MQIFCFVISQRKKFGDGSRDSEFENLPNLLQLLWRNLIRSKQYRSYKKFKKCVLSKMVGVVQVSAFR